MYYSQSYYKKSIAAKRENFYTLAIGATLIVGISLLIGFSI